MICFQFLSIKSLRKINLAAFRLVLCKKWWKLWNFADYALKTTLQTKHTNDWTFLENSAWVGLQMICFQLLSIKSLRKINLAVFRLVLCLKWWKLWNLVISHFKLHYRQNIQKIENFLKTVHELGFKWYVFSFLA